MNKTKENWKEEFDKRFIIELGGKIPSILKVEMLRGIKQFIKKLLQQQESKYLKVLREIPKKKNRLRNFLIGTEDEVFEENGMDGIIGWNKCVDKFESIIKDNNIEL